MEEQLVSFEVAKLTKEKGFDWGNHQTIYSPSGKELHYDESGYSPKVYILAPTQSLLQKWLRDTFGWNIEIKTPDGKKGMWLYEIHKVHGIGDYSKLNCAFPTYEEALEAGLLETLKLI